MTGAVVRQPKVVIVGAGMSGICQAVLLRRAGMTEVTILEKARSVGGTWRDNSYPGLNCDVPSHLYQYSFALEAGWSRLFSPGAEIRDYFTRVSRTLGVEKRVRFGAEVTAAYHDGERWQLTVNGTEQLDCDFVVFATGVLHQRFVPDIPGMADFRGQMFHSAKWDDAADVAGKRVAVIGNGSTGVQIVSALAGVAAHTTMFQRTPQWVMPIPNPQVPALLRGAMARVPLLRKAVQQVEWSLFEVFSAATTQGGLRRKAIQAACRANLATVKDPVLRHQLTPDYQPLCRRLVMHPSFYQKVQRPDVTVETAGIERIEAGGVRAKDGTLHEADIIVLATGFHAHNYLMPTTVQTHSGHSVAAAWAQSPRAYRSVTVADIPNMFLLLGPHSPIGNFSLVQISEAQASYVTRWVTRWAQGKFHTAAATEGAVEAYYAHIRDGLPNTVWATGCTSWYLGADGLPELWPYSPQQYLHLLETPDSPSYHLSEGAGQCPVRHS